MTKDVFLVLQGLHDLTAKEEDGVRTITPARYYYKNGSHYILYEEGEEEYDENTRNVIKFKKNYMEVTKKGPSSAHLLFEQKRKNLSNYETPFGGLIVGIDTESINIREKEDRITVDVNYALDINYEHVAACSIRLDIFPKELGKKAVENFLSP